MPKSGRKLHRLSLATRSAGDLDPKPLATFIGYSIDLVEMDANRLDWDELIGERRYFEGSKDSLPLGDGSNLEKHFFDLLRSPVNRMTAECWATVSSDSTSSSLVELTDGASGNLNHLKACEINPSYASSHRLDLEYEFKCS
jgi:hypothetical protein